MRYDVETIFKVHAHPNDDVSLLGMCVQILQYTAPVMLLMGDFILEKWPEDKGHDDDDDDRTKEIESCSPMPRRT